jgi:NRPS condensation-like uncharacterized protein
MFIVGIQFGLFVAVLGVFKIRREEVARILHKYKKYGVVVGDIYITIVGKSRSHNLFCVCAAEIEI